MEDKKYIFFPLCLLTDIYIQPENALSNIFDYGIYQVGHHLYSKQNNGVSNASERIRQAYQCVIKEYHCRNLVPEFSNVLDELFKLHFGQSFQPSGDGVSPHPRKELWVLETEGEVNEAFQQRCVRIFKICTALNFLRIEGDIESLYNVSLCLEQTVNKIEERFGKSPSVSIKTDLILDYCDNPKTEEDYELFAGYCAIKSFIGQKDFAITNKPSIIMRMCGAKNQGMLQSVLLRPEIALLHTKYSKKYNADKLITSLLKRNFFQSKIALPGTRRMYISCHLSHQELVVEINMLQGFVSRTKLIKEREKEAIAWLRRAQSQ